jgi:hypothetical protein
LSPYTPIGLITLIVITAVTVFNVIIICISAAVTFVITVLGLAFVYNILAVFIITIIIIFFS